MSIIEMQSAGAGNVVVMASEAAKQGAADASVAATETAASMSTISNKVVYDTFYYAAYGVTFGVLTIAKLLPLDNIVGNAVRDGAVAARDAMKKPIEQKAQAAAPSSMASEEQMAPA